MDSTGDIYGDTLFGGANNDGVVFRLHKTSSGWHEVVLHSFNGADGLNPDAPLVMDTAGNLFGTTSAGGANGFGIAGNICVLFTANDAYMRDLKLFAPADCIVSNTAADNDHALPPAPKNADICGSCAANVPVAFRASDRGRRHHAP